MRQMARGTAVRVAKVERCKFSILQNLVFLKFAFAGLAVPCSRVPNLAPASELSKPSVSQDEHVPNLARS